jgi:hypothetical protein
MAGAQGFRGLVADRPRASGAQALDRLSNTLRATVPVVTRADPALALERRAQGERRRVADLAGHRGDGGVGLEQEVGGECDPPADKNRPVDTAEIAQVLLEMATAEIDREVDLAGAPAAINRLSRRPRVPTVAA